MSTSLTLFNRNLNSKPRFLFCFGFEAPSNNKLDCARFWKILFDFYKNIAQYGIVLFNH